MLVIRRRAMCISLGGLIVLWHGRLARCPCQEKHGRDARATLFEIAMNFKTTVFSLSCSYCSAIYLFHADRTTRQETKNISWSM